MIKELWQNYITSGIQEKKDYQYSVKFIVVNCFTIAACSLLLTFSIVHLLLLNIIIGIFELVFFVISILNVILLRLHKKENIASSVILTYMIIILLALFIDGGFGNTGYLWYFAYPPLAFFLKGKKKGIIWLLIIPILTSIVFILQESSIIIKKSAYSFLQFLFLLICFCGISGLIYFYELVKNKLINLLDKSYQENIKNKIFEDQYLIAEKIQRSLIPEKDLILDKICITGYYKPAWNIGGDYYDYFTLGKNNIGIVLSDVSGKGIPACISMVNLRSTFKTLIKNKYFSPKDIVKKLNNIFVKDFKSDMFATFFYLVYNMNTKKIKFCNAGHGPFIYFSKKDNEFKEHFIQSLPVGVSDKTKDYKNKTIKLHSKDIFIIYSDGITEATNINNEDYGKQRLFDLIKNNSDSDLKKLKRIIIEDLKNYTGDSNQRDDIALVIAKVN